MSSEIFRGSLISCVEILDRVLGGVNVNITLILTRGVVPMRPIDDRLSWDPTANAAAGYGM